MNFPSHPPRPSIPPSLSQTPIPLDEHDFLDDNGQDAYERETLPGEYKPDCIT